MKQKVFACFCAFCLLLSACSAPQEAEGAAVKDSDAGGMDNSDRSSYEIAEENGIFPHKTEAETREASSPLFTEREAEVLPFDGGSLLYDEGSEAGGAFADSFSEAAADTEHAEARAFPAEERYDWDMPIMPPEPPRQKARAGLLTGGEWCDNQNFSFWTELVSDRESWNEMEAEWRLCMRSRICVRVVCGEQPAGNITVKLFSNDTLLWEAVTDNSGTAYLFSTLDKESQYVPTHITAEKDGVRFYRVDDLTGCDEFVISFPEKEAIQQTASGLDLMFMMDTTGSMGDELAYLQTELEDVVSRVSQENQVSTRLSVNFYRDTEDEYIVRGNSFTSDISAAVRIMNEQRASGGGDYPEAVEQALSHGIHDHGWNADNVKLLFLVLDAPPHHTEQNAEKLRSLLTEAAAKGIRIIPVASSGVDTETEFLCRSFAIATGGTYTFLTDDSGVGNSHLEPTIGYYQMENLNDMLIRIISGYLS